jgi:hypothetical protein
MPSAAHSLPIQIKSTFSSKLLATGVVVLVPVPENTSKATILVTAGRAKYDATKKALVWKVWLLLLQPGKLSTS